MTNDAQPAQGELEDLAERINRRRTNKALLDHPQGKELWSIFWKMQENGDFLDILRIVDREGISAKVNTTRDRHCERCEEETRHAITIDTYFDPRCEHDGDILINDVPKINYQRIYLKINPTPLQRAIRQRLAVSVNTLDVATLGEESRIALKLLGYASKGKSIFNYDMLYHLCDTHKEQEYIDQKIMQAIKSFSEPYNGFFSPADVEYCLSDNRRHRISKRYDDPFYDDKKPIGQYQHLDQKLLSRHF